MGLFDSVYLPCPHCQTEIEFQSKVFPDAYLRAFPPHAVPSEMAADILTDDEYNHDVCENCGTHYQVVSDPPLPRTVRMQLVVKSATEDADDRTT